MVTDPQEGNSKLKMEFGGYLFISLAVGLLILAIVMTILNQKQLKAAEGKEKKKGPPTFASLWDLKINFNSLIYPRRLNSSI